jgi:hypothetical protein
LEHVDSKFIQPILLKEMLLSGDVDCCWDSIEEDYPAQGGAFAKGTSLDQDHGEELNAR